MRHRVQHRDLHKSVGNRSCTWNCNIMHRFQIQRKCGSLSSSINICGRTHCLSQPHFFLRSPCEEGIRHLIHSHLILSLSASHSYWLSMCVRCCSSLSHALSHTHLEQNVIQIDRDEGLRHLSDDSFHQPTRTHTSVSLFLTLLSTLTMRVRVCP